LIETKKRPRSTKTLGAIYYLAISGLQYSVLLEGWSTPLNSKAVFQICFDAPVHRMGTAFQNTHSFNTVFQRLSWRRELSKSIPPVFYYCTK